MAKQVDQAISSWEAACILGVHWTTPARMSQKGLLTARLLMSPTKPSSDRVFAVYSLAECEKDWADYEEKLVQGGTGKRPRGFADLRPAMVKALAKLPHQIAFGDAVSAAEAGKILGVHWTFVPRLANAGHIVGRVMRNDRNKAGRCWIFSRASCEANVSKIRRLEAAGLKRGRPRKPA